MDAALSWEERHGDEMAEAAGLAQWSAVNTKGNGVQVTALDALLHDFRTAVERRVQLWVGPTGDGEPPNQRRRCPSLDRSLVREEQIEL